ncbi:hypothetical protein IM40_05685 [Candidatus Paracaedimonas acanthamoebae]|nr:hypothetical protein IM40_05685 [Candidatus Paracaedimonas acanthamoebae]
MNFTFKNGLKAALLTTLLSSLAYGENFVVQNNNDAGVGSLRNAIQLANEHADLASTITFKPGVGEKITLASHLPII